MLQSIQAPKLPKEEAYMRVKVHVALMTLYSVAHMHASTSITQSCCIRSAFQGFDLYQHCHRVASMVKTVQHKDEQEIV